MAAKVASAAVIETSTLQYALQTSLCELKYARSTRDYDSIVRDEDVRRLRVEIQLLSDENETLVEELTVEEERSEDLEANLNEALARVEELDGAMQTLSNELRAKTRELDNMSAEIDAYQSMSSDSKKILKEKLALQSELSKVKPELEHLRAEAAAHREMLAEKLSLQREVSTLQVELDNSKRQNKRAKADKGKSEEQDEKLEARVEELHQKLIDQTQALKEAKRESDRLQRELAAEKQTADRNDAKQAKGAAEDGKFKAQLEELRKELAAEKRERQKSERALEKERTAWEAQKSILDDKLDQFRTKLRSTKEKLKGTEAELVTAQASATAHAAQPSKQALKNPRKRPATEVDPDAAIGTPGDAVPAKRGKRVAAAIPGDKSLFSITPFLNRTTSIAPDSPVSERNAEEATIEGAGAEATPSALPRKRSKKVMGKEPLGPAPSTKQNANTKPPVVRKKAAAKTTLENVVEESAEAENEPAVTKIPLKDADEPTNAATAINPVSKLIPKSKKPRKSLADISTFNLEESAAGTKIVKKKRKLLGNNSSFLGGGAKTLFDEEDGEKPPPKPIPGRGLFAARVLGKSASLLGGKAGLKKPLMEDAGFQFSPLKKDRRAAAAALRV